jgi:hypothetical protein
MYAHIGRLAILHISTRTFICTREEKKKNVAISGVRAYKGLSGNGFTKTVTPHLRSIVPSVQRHMAYFAAS